jgi:hypothetical protein
VPLFPAAIKVPYSEVTRLAQQRTSRMIQSAGTAPMDKSALLLVWAFVMAVVEALGQIVSALHFLFRERLPWAVTAPDCGARRNRREPAPNPPRHRGKGFLFWPVVGLGAALH